MDHERVFIPLDLNDVTTNAYDDQTIYHQQHESGRGEDMVIVWETCSDLSKQPKMEG